MSLFTVLVIIFIVGSIVRSFLKHVNEQKPQSSGFNWNNYHSSRLRSILSTYNSFEDEDIIDSAVGFYLFSYNDDTREFIFIQEDGIKVINHFRYEQLVSYNIRNTRDYGIFIDFKTNVANKSYVSIECFNRETAIKKIPYLSSNTAEVDNLYRLEQEKVEEIGDILQEIVEGNKEKVLPPPYQEEIAITPPPLIIPLPLEDEIQVIEIEEEPVPIVIEEHTSFFDKSEPETYEIQQEEVDEEFAPYTLPEPDEQPEIHIEEEESVFSEIEVDNEMIEVLLSDIDEYSRGKFIDWEVQSAVGDAKMKGEKCIYLNAEQVEKLKS